MKYILWLITAISLITISAFANAQQRESTNAQKKLISLEKQFDGKIGVYALNTNN
jgi:hypothetical protein